MRIALLPEWEAPRWDGIIGKAFSPESPLPDSWKPEKPKEREVPAFAFPTPFAWAEMMAAIIRWNLFGHILFKLYENLVLGLVLGYIQLDVVDLKHQGGKFGEVLAQTDGRYRYLGVLRGSPKNVNLRGKVFGATSPDSLFWPSPQRSDDEWSELQKAITGDSKLSEARQLLADFRELLRSNQLWKADDKHPWVRGLDQILGEQEPSNGCKLFHAHCRSVGPILTTVAGEDRPLYIPVYEEGFAASMVKALTGPLKKEGDIIELRDDRGITHYEILMPSVPPGGSHILAGAGTVRIVDRSGSVRSFGSNRVRLHGDAGLFSLLQPLYEEFRRNMGDINVDDIKDRPFFYPDAIRVTVSRLGEAGLPGTNVSFSDRAYELAFEPDGPGLPLASKVRSPSDRLENPAEEARGYVLQHTRGTTVYIEEYAGHLVGDLRAFGYILWLFFTGSGSAEYRDGMIRDSRLVPLLSTSMGQPLYPTNEVYNAVNGERGKHRRLATLQRFVKAYKAYSDREESTSLDRLCYEAAVAFARWVWSEDVIPNGHKPRRQQEVQLGDLKVNLAID